MDRVTVLEEGQRKILEVQTTILHNQNNILSRLTALEKNGQVSSTAFACYTQDDSGAAGDLSMDYDDMYMYMVPPTYIPPPRVQHFPPHHRLWHQAPVHDLHPPHNASAQHDLHPPQNASAPRDPLAPSNLTTGLAFGYAHTSVTSTTWTSCSCSISATVPIQR